MSGYGSMQASPLWKWIMRITGILCFVTLMIPPAYYLKYIMFDQPVEAAAARAGLVPALMASNANYREKPNIGFGSISIPGPETPVLTFRYIDLERHLADHASNSTSRILAVDWLTSLVVSRGAQVTHPVECFYAKMTIGGIASSDPDPAVRETAFNALTAVAARGAVIRR